VALLDHESADVRQMTLFVLATIALHNKTACLSLIEAGALNRVLALMPDAVNQPERVR
jgi:hypothetical protein